MPVASTSSSQGLPRALSIAGRGLARTTGVDPGIAVLSSGIEALDALLPHGGIVRGRLTELSGTRSCGKRALAATICAQALRQGARAAWIDAVGGFYPLPSLELGAPLERLLVVRLGGQSSSTRARLREVLKATDMLLAAGSALALIVVDLGPCVERPALSQLGRLRLGAESSGAAVLFITEKRARMPSLGTFICLHLAVRRQPTPRDDAKGGRAQGRWGGLRVSIVKSKLGRMAHQVEIGIDGPHSMCVDTTV